MERITLLREMPGLLRSGIHRPRWVIDRVLPDGGVTLLYGASGSGKTGLAIATALAVASGERWAGRTVEGGGVLYIAAEDRNGVIARVVASAQATDRLGAPVAVVGRPRQGLARQGAREAIARLVDKAIDELNDDIALIVIDTLSCAFGENSQDDAGPASIFMNVAEDVATRYGCALVVIHHTGKTGTSMRGSQVFYDRADAVLKVRVGAAGPTVEVEKQRNGPGGARFAFEVGSHDLTLPAEDPDDPPEVIPVQLVSGIREVAPVSAPADADTGKPTEKPETDAESMFRILVEIQEVTGVTAPVTVADWKAAVFEAWKTKTEGARKSAFSKGCKSLKAQGKISLRGQKVTAKVTGNSTGNEDTAVTSYRYHPPSKRGVDGNVGNAALRPASETVAVEPPDAQIDKRTRP